MPLLMPSAMPIFFTSLFLGSLIAISSNSWVFIWIGLELNLLSFIALLSPSSSNQETSAMMKYFLVQAMASGLLLLFSTLLTLDPKHTSHFVPLTLTMALMVKAGLPPCHFWLPSVMASLNWTLCLTLATWQKIAPITLIIFTPTPLNLLTLTLIMAGLIISGVGGLNQTQIRSLLAYSSIGHMSWMMAASMTSSSTALLYFLVYLFSSLPIFMMLKNTNTDSPLTKSNTLNNQNMLPSTMPIFLFSLAGLPPMLGFLPKWLALESITLFLPIMTLFLILGSTLNMAYYLNLAFSLQSLPLKKNLISPNYPLTWITSALMMTIFSLPLLIYAMTLLN